MATIKLCIYLDVNDDDTFNELEVELYETVNDALQESFGATNGYELMFEEYLGD